MYQTDWRAVIADLKQILGNRSQWAKSSVTAIHCEKLQQWVFVPYAFRFNLSGDFTNGPTKKMRYNAVMIPEWICVQSAFLLSWKNNLSQLANMELL